MLAQNEKRVESYPPAAVSNETRVPGERPMAVIASVEPDSPAYAAGFESGCALTTLDGVPLVDILWWRWFSDADQITVGYIDNDGDEGEVVLTREGDEPWGFEFDSTIFDGVHECRNACTFCFVRQLPPDLRPSLRLRDDDFRLSFLNGTFITLTNLTKQEEERIVDQHLMPLHVSLQAVDPHVRERLMGKHASQGFAALERLLHAGITCYCQIVLVPGINDGPELQKTLDWAYEHPGIKTVGIVPLGYTSHQDTFVAGYDRPRQAEEIIELLRPYQERALKERGEAWVYAADEFYLTAYGKQIFDLLPQASFYGNFDMFEDGIGMVRSTLDEWERAREEGLVHACGVALQKSQSTVLMVSGFAQQAYLTLLMRDPELNDRLMPLYVENHFFGGNVDVTGLLTGQDIVRAIVALQPVLSHGKHLIALPNVIFNDDGVTLDDMTLEDIANQVEVPVSMVSCSPLDYLKEIITLVA